MTQFARYFSDSGEVDYLRKVVSSILGEGAPPSPQDPLRMIAIHALPGMPQRYPVHVTVSEICMKRTPIFVL
jgi:hypothetical protein